MTEEKPTLRLTLRTLLAYLDDELDPQQSQQIGQQLRDSPAAQEVMQRISGILRQRRLLAEEAQTDSDPNDVAEYLDSAMPADQVAGFEQSCLDADAKLAEVAAVHQILSIVLGEPAPISQEQRQRLLQASGVPGATASASGERTSARAIGPDRELGVGNGRVDLQGPAAAAPKGSLGTTLLVLGLVILLGISVQQTLAPPAGYQATGPQINIARWTQGNLPGDVGAADPEPAPTEPVVEPAPADDPNATTTPATENPAAPDPAMKPADGTPTPAGTEVAMKPATIPAPAPEAAPAPQAAPAPHSVIDLIADYKGSVHPYPLVSTPAGFLLLADSAVAPVSAPLTEVTNSAALPGADQPAAPEPAAEAAPANPPSPDPLPPAPDGAAPAPGVDPADPAAAAPALPAVVFGFQRNVRLLNFDGCRTRYLTDRGASVDLVDRTAVWLMDDWAEDEGILLEPVFGRLVIQTGPEDAAFRVLLNGHLVVVSVAGNGSLVGLEVAPTSFPTADSPNQPLVTQLTLHVTRGKVALRLDGADKPALDSVGGHVAVVSFPEGARESADPFPQAPAWMSPDMDAVARRRLERFLGALPKNPGMPVAEFDRQLQLSLRELSVQGTPDVAALAAAALAWMGSYQELASTVRQPGVPEVVAFAGAAATRDRLRSDPKEIAVVRDLLVRLSGPAAGAWIADLLVGYSEDARRAPATYRQLILDNGLLEVDELSIRRLAIWNLQQMVGTDRGYKAEATGLARTSGVRAWRSWAEKVTEKQLERSP